MNPSLTRKGFRFFRGLGFIPYSDKIRLEPLISPGITEGRSYSVLMSKEDPLFLVFIRKHRLNTFLNSTLYHLNNRSPGGLQMLQRCTQSELSVVLHSFQKMKISKGFGKCLSSSY